MEIYAFIQKYFVLLIPGIIGILLYHKLNTHKEQHYYLEFIKIITYSIFSFIFSDITFLIIKKLFPCFIFSPINVIQYIYSTENTIPTPNVIVAIIYAILLACILTKANTENWLFSIANKLKITRRIDNQPVWEHAFDTNDIIVLRDYITKNIYYGKVISYSDNSEIREIRFQDVRVFNEHAEFLYHAEEMYLSRAYNEFSIEIQNYNDNNKTEGQKDEKPA